MGQYNQISRTRAFKPGAANSEIDLASTDFMHQAWAIYEPKSVELANQKFFCADSVDFKIEAGLLHIQARVGGEVRSFLADSILSTKEIVKSLQWDCFDKTNLRLTDFSPVAQPRVVATLPNCPDIFKIPREHFVRELVTVFDRIPVGESVTLGGLNLVRSSQERVSIILNSKYFGNFEPVYGLVCRDLTKQELLSRAAELPVELYIKSAANESQTQNRIDRFIEQVERSHRPIYIKPSCESESKRVFRLEKVRVLGSADEGSWALSSNDSDLLSLVGSNLSLPAETCLGRSKLNPILINSESLAPVVRAVIASDPNSNPWLAEEEISQLVCDSFCYEFRLAFRVVGDQRQFNLARSYAKQSSAESVSSNIARGVAKCVPLRTALKRIFKSGSDEQFDQVVDYMREKAEAVLYTLSEIEYASQLTLGLGYNPNRREVGVDFVLSRGTKQQKLKLSLMEVQLSPGW
jgi:hypothetical protein